MQIYPISKLLDVMKFPVNSPDEVGPLGTLPHVQLLARRSVKTPLDSSSASGLPSQLTEVEFDIVIDKPCWGTLKLSGVDLVSWSIAPGQDAQQEAAAFMGRQQRSGGSGSGFTLQTASGKGSVAWGQATVSNLMVKFTNERWQGPLRWRVVARFVESDGSSSSSSSPKALLQVDLHVGHVDATPQLSAMEARMPAWATLSYHATSFASRWQF
jgi:hypothetical protein